MLVVFGCASSRKYRASEFFANIDSAKVFGQVIRGGKQRLIFCLTNVLYHSHTLLFKHKKIPLSVVLRTRNVLIVEDHRTQRPEVHTIPGQMRYKVRVVRSGNHLKPRGGAI